MHYELNWPYDLIIIYLYFLKSVTILIWMNFVDLLRRNARNNVMTDDTRSKNLSVWRSLVFRELETRVQTSPQTKCLHNYWAVRCSFKLDGEASEVWIVPQTPRTASMRASSPKNQRTRSGQCEWNNTELNSADCRVQISRYRFHLMWWRCSRCRALVVTCDYSVCVFFGNLAFTRRQLNWATISRGWVVVSSGTGWIRAQCSSKREKCLWQKILVDKILWW